MTRKALSVLLTFFLTAVPLSISSCSKNNTDTVREDSIGNPDFESNYYNSSVIRIDLDPEKSSDYSNPALFEKGDGEICLVPGDHFGGNGYDATCYILDKDGIKSEFTIDGDWNAGGGSIIALDDDSFIISDYNAGTRIYDYEGNLLREFTPDTEVGKASGKVAVSDDFVVMGNSEGATVLDHDFNILGRIDVNVSDTLFCQEGRFYATDGVSVYCLNTDNLTSEFKLFVSDIVPENEGNGIRNYRYFCDRVAGLIYEADIENKELVPLARLDNIIEYQGRPQRWNNAVYNIEVISDDIFYKSYMSFFEGNRLDIALIYRDPDLDLASREVITVGGVGASFDSFLQQAVYNFNSSQDQYLVKIEDLASDYDMSVPEEATQAHLEMLTEFNKGNTPDIFYGSDFDYLYWGKSGMVMDIKPYLDEFGVFDRESITPNILDLMEVDGAIYQVFPGYDLMGYWGDIEQYPSSDISAFAMPQLREGQSRFSTAFSSSIAYNILGYDLRNFWDEDIFDLDTMTALTRLATSEGITESEYLALLEMNGYQPLDESNASLIEGGVCSLPDYLELMRSQGDVMLNWIGFPSLTDSIHPIWPQALMAVSSGTSDPEACCEFISYLYGLEYQRYLAGSGILPVNDQVLQEMLASMHDPENMPEELSDYYNSILPRSYPNIESEEWEYAPVDQEIIDLFLDNIHHADAINAYDWGVRQIINEELDGYYNSGKTIEETAEALYSRLRIYAAENY